MALSALLLALCGGGVGAARLGLAAADAVAAAPVADALKAELQRPGGNPELEAFYAARGYRPLWVQASRADLPRPQAALRPEARQLARMVGEAPPAAAGAPGSGIRLNASLAEARGGGPARLAAADLALSAALADYAAGRGRVVQPARPAFVDPGFAPRAVTTGKALAAASHAPSLTEHLDGLEAVNPVHRTLKEGLEAYRAEWSRLPRVHVPSGDTLQPGDRGSRVEALRSRLGVSARAGAGLLFDPLLEKKVRRFQAAHGLPVTGRADPRTVEALNAGPEPFEKLILANLERARALPPPVGDRYVLVNVPAQRLWLYEGDAPQGDMRIVVGTRGAQTPAMAGLMRYVVLNPYWNVPVDLVRDSVAPQVRRFGPGWLKAHAMEVLSDWGDRPIIADPLNVDWAAVADGRTLLRVRQRPGGENMMGRVKFMLPNELGIYLHDTPDKAVFRTERRLVSAGCVRVERAAELVGWLFGPEAWGRTTSPARRLDLQRPMTVYITYLTAAPAPGGGVAFHPDIYGRDPALIAALP